MHFTDQVDVFDMRAHDNFYTYIVRILVLHVVLCSFTVRMLCSKASDEFTKIFSW